MTTGLSASRSPCDSGRSPLNDRRYLTRAASEFDDFCRFAFTFLENQGLRYLVMTVDVDLDLAARLRAARAAE